MTDEPTKNLPAKRAERQAVTNLVAVFDTNQFDQLGRIAAVMASSSFVPASLKGGGRDEAVANCFQVAELALRWNMSPFAVAQCASVVYGKLMLEGKLVHARLQSRGVDLNCYFKGEVGTDAFRIYVTDVKLSEKQFDALKPKTYPFDVKMIDGCVGDWKTYEKDKRTVNGAWLNQPDMQLRYRGARVWCRAYRPDEMLGIYTEDDFDDLRERSVHVTGVETIPQRLTTGFGDETDQNFRKTAERTEETVTDAEVEEAESHPTETASAPTAEAEQDTSVSATPASTDSAAETSGQPAPEPKSNDGGADEPSGLAACINQMAESKDWLGIKQAINTYGKLKPNQQEQDKVLVEAWAAFNAFDETERKKTPIVSDALLFRLWLRHGEHEPTDIDKQFAVFVRSEAWRRAADPLRTLIGDEMRRAKEPVGA